MAKSRNAVITTGIPGVGKTTVIDGAIEYINNEFGEEVKVINFGTEMFEVASARGLIANRDEIRKLPTDKQREIQQLAGESIAKKAEASRVIVDTHTLIETPNGFLIGLPEWVVKAIMPKTIVLIEAEPKNIASRRAQDETRDRDVQLTAEITSHQEMCRAAAAAAGTLTGATIRIIKNYQGKAEEAATKLAETVME